MIKINSADGLFHDGDPVAGIKGTKVTAAWLNAVQADLLAAAGTATTVSGTTTLTEQHGVVFVDTTAGDVTIHLPVLASVGAGKRYTVKNIGGNKAIIDAADGKTIDGAATLELTINGEKATLCPDGANWQTI